MKRVGTIVVAAGLVFAFSNTGIAEAGTNFGGVFKAKHGDTLTLIQKDDRYLADRVELAGRQRTRHVHKGVGLVMGGRLWVGMTSNTSPKAVCPIYVYKLSGRKATGRFAQRGREGVGTETVTKLTWPRKAGKKRQATARGEDQMGLKHTATWTVSRGDGGKNTFAIHRSGGGSIGAVSEGYSAYRVGKIVGVTNSSCRLFVYKLERKRLMGTEAALFESVDAGGGSSSASHTKETFKRMKTPGLVYRAGGLTVSIPAGWKANGKGKFRAARAVGGYHDNIAITLTKPLPINKKNAKPFIKVLASQFKSMFGDFKVMSARLRKFGRYTAVHIVGAVTVKGQKLLIDQAIISTPRAGLMIGCNYPTKRKRSMAKLCQKTFKSVR